MVGAASNGREAVEHVEGPLLVLAGLNTAVFQFGTYRGVDKWEREGRIPFGAKLAGALSIVLWIGVVGFGRWIGFTK